MSAPLVSIAIVTHNNWPDLELAIVSALGQSWANTEVDAPSASIVMSRLIFFIWSSLSDGDTELFDNG